MVEFKTSSPYYVKTIGVKMFQALIEKLKLGKHNQSRGHYLGRFLLRLDDAIGKGQLLNIEGLCTIGMLDAGSDAPNVAEHFNMHRDTISRLQKHFRDAGDILNRPCAKRTKCAVTAKYRCISTTLSRNGMQPASTIPM